MGVENTVCIITELYKINDVTFNFYGPHFDVGSTLIYNDPENKNIIEPINYDKKITAKDLVNIFNPDIILMSYREELEYWIPSDLHKVDVPVVSIEADYQLYEDKPEWFEKYVDLMVMMSYFDKTPIQSVWWPFSVRNDIINNCDINYESDRLDKIFFQGSIGIDCYQIRNLAIKTLLETNLIHYNANRVAVNKYLEEMVKYKGMLTCSSIYHTPLAKMFESMLTKTASLTNWFKGSTSLFGDEKCYFEYKDDCSDIHKVAKQLIYDNDMRNDMIDKAYTIVSNNHTSVHRVLELYTILKTFVSTGEIVRKWNH